MYSIFALLECVCEPTLSHQTASIKPLQKCGPYMPMAVLIRINFSKWHFLFKLALKKSCYPEPAAGSRNRSWSRLDCVSMLDNKMFVHARIVCTNHFTCTVREQYVF